MKHYLPLCLICLAYFTSYSQEENVEYSDANEFVETFKNRITAKLFYVNTYNSYVFSDRNSNLSFDLEPNKQNRIGASIAYDFLSLSYSFAPNFMAENEDNEDSKLFNLDFRLFLGKWMQELYYNHEKGFYLTEKDNDLNFEVYLPKTAAFKIGGSTSYIFNENFSYRSIYNQSQKQLKSAGSFIPGVYYYYSKIKLRADNSEESVTGELKSFDVALNAAYYYNFVPVRNLLLSAGGGAGLGMNHSSSDDEDLTSLLTELNFSLAVNYDIGDFFVGSHFNYLILNHNTDRTTYTEDNIPKFQIYAGYRFKASKKMVKKTEELKDKVNL
ncbi:DUF4421 domain-containing protein [Aegicerativicinus sediminis]|uniref:DUF4421 domain-containing protein n=1 Tax=Aegicerativicinus sediminis TaxID=2893202 RepID=UPI001E3A5397|nr:DUF4421 domain-containing protein [Aegicerativicinus sediminis]